MYFLNPFDFARVGGEYETTSKCNKYVNEIERERETIIKNENVAKSTYKKHVANSKGQWE